MKMKILLAALLAACLPAIMVQAQIGKRFPSERKVIKDPATGVTLTLSDTQSVDLRWSMAYFSQWPGQR
jgi:oligogalacturonide lyase